LASKIIGTRASPANFADLDADGLSLPLRAQVALHHECFCPFAHDHKEAGQFSITDKPLPGRCERESKNGLVGKG
jgi:hypothetical protein